MPVKVTKWNFQKTLKDGTPIKLEIELAAQFHHPVYEEKTGDAYNVFLKEIGNYEIEYDFEELFCAPYPLSVTLIDINKNFINDLFGYFSLQNFNRGVCNFYLKYEDEWELEYSGKILEETIKYNYKDKILEFEIVGFDETLKNIALYDSDNNPINPLNYQPNNYYNIVRIINDIYKTINSSIEVSINHDWIFYGENPPNPPRSDITFEQLYQYVNPLFFNNAYGVSNLQALIQKLAIDWGCVTGLLHYKKAFFRKIFRYSSYFNCDLRLIDYEIEYLPSVLYTEFRTLIGSIRKYSAGVFTQVPGRYIVRNPVLPGFYSGTNRGTNVLAVVNNTTYYVYGVKDPWVSQEFLDNGELLAQFWFKARNLQSSYNKKIKLKLSGLKFYFDTFSYWLPDYLNLSILQPFRLFKNYNDCTTEVEAVIVGGMI